MSKDDVAPSEVPQQERGVLVDVGEAVLSVCTAGLWALGGLYVVGPRETRIVLHMGKVTRVCSEPGLYWAPSFGREDRLQTTADISWTVPELKVVDISGVPIVVSAVLVYRVVDSKKAQLDVLNVNKYVQSQASAALKLIVSRYSYEALKVETAEVQEQVCECPRRIARPIRPGKRLLSRRAPGASSPIRGRQRPTK